MDSDTETSASDRTDMSEDTYSSGYSSDASSDTQTASENEEDDLGAQWLQAKGKVLSRLVGGRAVQLVGLDEEETWLRGVVSGTVVRGEGNSVLLTGPRGTGKTALVAKVLRDIRTMHGTNSGTGGHRFKTVTLSGHYHTDDKIALKDIVRQMKIPISFGSSGLGEDDSDERELDEFGEEEVAEDVVDLEGKSFPATLTNVLTYFQAGNKENFPIVFVLEEFDLFGQHQKQMLLYNILDMSQTPGIPVCVIGTTCRVDCLDLLEKRVKSRFSHRQIQLGLPKDMETYSKIVEQAIKLSPENDGLMDYPLIYTAYNQLIDEFFINDPNVRAFMYDEFDLSKSVRRVFQQLYKGVAGLTLQFNHISEINDFEDEEGDYYDPENPDFNKVVSNVVNYSRDYLKPKMEEFWDVTRRTYRHAESFGVKQLLALSQLELVLLGAILDFYRLDVEQFNFEMTYDKYKEMVIRHSKQNDMLFTRPVALRSFQQLENVNAIHPSESATTKCPREYRMFRLACYPFQIEQALKTSGLPWAMNL